MGRINPRRALRASTKAGHKNTKECMEVSVYWNDSCLQQDQYEVVDDKPFRYTIGETPECRFMVDRDFIQTSEYSFIEIAGGEVLVNIPPFSQGTVTQGDVSESFTPHDQVRQYPLTLHGQLVCELGPWTFAFRRIIEENTAPYGLGLNFIPNRWTYISVAAHAAFFLLISMVPPEAAGMNFDDELQQNRFIKYMIPAAEQRQVEDVEIEPDRGEQGNPGTKLAGDEGKAGDHKAKPSNRRMAIAGPLNIKRPTIGKELLKTTVNTTGILTFMDKKTMVSPLGVGDTIGRDPENALGNLTGDAPGSSFGYGGYGIKGAGRGGGGTTDGTVGVKDIGFGKFGHDPSGRCVGELCGISGAKALKRERPVHSNIEVGKVGKVAGSLSRDVIRRHIRRKINQVRFCYEKALVKNESLSGRVSVTFMINAGGAVTRSFVSNSTLASTEVERCIADVVKRITFPNPPDGGTVMVTYPFNLVSSSR